MAELNVEKKKKSPIGWIILGIVVIGLIIWFATSNNEVKDTAADFRQDREQTSEYSREQSQAVTPYDGERGRTETNSRVQAFLTFVDEEPKDSVSTAYVQEGINKLSDALMAVSREQTQGQDTWGGELQQIKQEANKLQDRNLNTQHATVVRSAFSSAANLIQNIQNRYYPELKNEASDVMDAAQEIEDQELVSEQEDEIHSFFEEAAKKIGRASCRGRV